MSFECTQTILDYHEKVWSKEICYFFDTEKYVMLDVFKISAFFSGSKQKRRRKNNRKMTKNFKNEVLKN